MFIELALSAEAVCSLRRVGMSAWTAGWQDLALKLLLEVLQAICTVFSGYLFITNIPAGATDIQVIERRKTENILGKFPEEHQGREAVFFKRFL